jgi:DNA-binding NtrC family response regulator
VLLVEDDPVALEELQEVIDIEGWTSVVATNVETALNLLKDNPDIRIVVTDVHFADPDGEVSNGIQLVSRSRAWFSDRPLSFIVLSGDPDAMASSAQEGAFDFLSKPLRPQTLVAAIHKALSGGESLHSPTYVKQVLIDRVKERTNEMFGIKSPGSSS